jgi:hypothetical protein
MLFSNAMYAGRVLWLTACALTAQLISALVALLFLVQAVRSNESRDRILPPTTIFYFYIYIHSLVFRTTGLDIGYKVSCYSLFIHRGNRT